MTHDSQTTVLMISAVEHTLEETKKKGPMAFLTALHAAGYQVVPIHLDVPRIAPAAELANGQAREIEVTAANRMMGARPWVEGMGTLKPLMKPTLPTE